MTAWHGLAVRHEELCFDRVWLEGSGKEEALGFIHVFVSEVIHLLWRRAEPSPRGTSHLTNRSGS